MTCHNGTLFGSCIDPVVNAMPNRQAPRSSALLRLPKAPKALLLQHTSVEKFNMVATKRLSWTSGFALMTSSAM
jgi:hypothetical protein